MKIFIKNTKSQESRRTILFVALALCLYMNIIACVPAEKPAKKPLEFTVLYNERDETPFQDNWLILKEYEKRKNVILDIRSGDDADYDELLQKTFETGDTPDIVLKVWPDTLASYTASDMLLAFSDYEYLMPSFMNYIEKYKLKEELDRLRLADDKYYILPGYQRKIQVQQWIYRRDIFEKHNLGIPSSYQELFDSLLYLKEEYPFTTPLTANWEGAHLFAMVGAGYGIPAGWNGNRYYNQDLNLWQFAPATINYHEMFRFLNLCYQAGILDPAMFTQDWDEYSAKLQDGRGLVTVTWITSGFRNWNEQLAANGFPDGEWAPFPVPKSTIGITALPAVDPFRKGLAVPSKVINEPYFENLLQFLDWAVYSEEGMTLTTWGVEDITFENTPEGRTFVPNIKTSKNPQGTLDITGEYGLAALFDLNENEEFENYKKPPEIVDFLERSLQAGETAQLTPNLKLDENAQEAIRILDQRIVQYVTEKGQQFIRGELNIEEDWNRYIEELEKMGYRTLEEIWNTSWELQNIGTQKGND
jgi:putative aldouronate transport system substrate-binding protein